MKFYKYIFLLPNFEDVRSCKRVIQDLSEQYKTTGYILAVDDGSVSECLSSSDIIECGIDGEVLKIERNIGNQAAISFALKYLQRFQINYDSLIIMDSDGEDSPSDVDQLLQKLERADVDVVVASRSGRHNSTVFKLMYFFYKLAFKLLSGKYIDFGNFMAIRSRHVKRLSYINDVAIHFPAAVLNSRLRVARVRIARGKRIYGESKMNYSSLILHGVKSLIVLSDTVIVRLIIACSVVILLIILGFFLVLILKLAGYTITGWASTVLISLFLILLQVGMFSLLSLLIVVPVKFLVSYTHIFSNFLDDKI